MWCCKKDLRSRSLLSSRFLFFHCRYAASDASLREDSEEESVPSPSVVVVVVCDDTSDELDDSEFRDVFRCKVNLVYSSDVAAAFFSEILWQFKVSNVLFHPQTCRLLKHNLGFDIYIKHKSWRYRKLLTTNEGSAEGLLMSGVR